MLPPSATDDVADKDTVVTSTSSVMVVLAGVLLATRFSKLPPAIVATVAVALPPPAYTLSPAGILTVPALLPTGIVIVWPLDSVATTGEPVTFAGRLSV